MSSISDLGATRTRLFEGLIDDAGLFPPAEKPLPQAVDHYASWSTGPFRWMTGRFLCPVSRLSDLTAFRPEARDWELGVVLDGIGADWSAVVAADIERAAGYSGPGRVVALEGRLPADGDGRAHVATFLEAFEDAGMKDLSMFLEVTTRDEFQFSGALEAIADAADSAHGAGHRHVLGAKLRCGGLTAAAIPADSVVAGFIRHCRLRELSFKLTAGLHNACRVPFDGAADSFQHGFLNMVAATALDLDDLEQIVAEREPAAFRLDQDGFHWWNATADLVAITHARALFVAFGSCSLDEPVAGLAQIGF